MRKIVFFGGFHNRPPVALRAAFVDGAPVLSAWQERKLARHFCPSRANGCLCGGRKKAAMDVYGTVRP